MTPGSGASAWGHRIATAVLVVVLLALVRAWFPDRDARTQALYSFVLSLGYAHLLGAALFAGSRRRPGPHRPSSRKLTRCLIATALVSAFGAYSWVLSACPMLALVLLALSTWHVFENDLLLGRAYAQGLRIGPVPRALDRHLLALGLTALALALFASALESDPSAPAFGSGFSADRARGLARGSAASIGLLLMAGSRSRLRLAGAVLATLALCAPARLPPWLGYGELFAASALYHLVGWLLFFLHRTLRLARASRVDARRLLLRLAAVHAPSLLVVGILALAPPQLEAGLRIWLFTPELYLFWSVLHVFHTLAVRGVEQS